MLPGLRMWTLQQISTWELSSDSPPVNVPGIDTALKEGSTVSLPLR